METVPLTSLARAGGCAAKYSAARLETLLSGLVPAEAEDLLVGLDPADDAAVYRLDDERALVFTVDFFPPLVDDPRTFGAIAATNALNDVFAMGGVPLLALSIAAFPEELPVEVLGDVLAGADERVRAAGAILAGGHTIRDTEPKYGLAVVGTVHPDAIWPKAGAAPWRRALPHQAARHRDRPSGGARRNRPRGRARCGDRVDARAEPGRGRRASAVHAERRDGRHRLRAARSRPRARRAEWRARGDRGRRAAVAPLRRSSLRSRAFGPGAIAATATTPKRTSRATLTRRSRRSRTTRRPRAACSSRCPRSEARSSRRRSRQRGSA